MQYLTIIRKSEFVDLFKYGHLYVRKATSFEGDICVLKDNEEKFNEVTSEMNLFEYSFEYLMLHFNSDKELSYNPEVELSEVQRVYVFNIEAKKEMSISFDSRIQIHVSEWAPLFNKLQVKLFQKQNMRGVDNLWKIFNLDDTDKQKCAEIITEPIISETFRQLYNNERPHGEISPWIYLLRYERHSLYPKSKKGFFCDFIHVYLNWKDGEEHNGDYAERTELCSQLRGKLFKELISVVEKSPLSEDCRRNIPNCNFYIVAPLYLYLKSLSGDRLKWNKEIEPVVKYSKNNYRFDFSLATYLLGITLGYDGTYDCLYDSVGLSIFRPKVIPSDSLAEQEEAPVCNGDSEKRKRVIENNIQDTEETARDSNTITEESTETTQEPLGAAEQPQTTENRTETGNEMELPTTNGKISSTETANKESTLIKGQVDMINQHKFQIEPSEGDVINVNNQDSNINDDNASRQKDLFGHVEEPRTIVHKGRKGGKNYGRKRNQKERVTRI